jgi:FAD/FMN-containing dehydrogenase/Fe-S oxidoreductase
MTNRPLAELEHLLRARIAGEARFDPYTRLMFSTDGSFHQMIPVGVVFPKQIDDLCAIVESAAEVGVPVLPRGAGTSLAGQTVGAALIVDCARHLAGIHRLEAEAREAEVEPGVVCSHLNRAARRHGLMFGPDPASADRATLGGMIGNNSTGAHSIRYGMSGDHVLGLDVVLSDGRPATLGPLDEAAARVKAQLPGVEGRIYQEALRLRDEYAGDIRDRWPRTWRRASGYSLHYLTGFAASAPPAWFEPGLAYPPLNPPMGAGLNLAPVLAGSEGTLALFRRARVRLVPRPAATVLVVLSYNSAAEACDAIPELLTHKPAAVELLPGEMLRRTRNVPAYARRMTFASGEEEALLVVEFPGNSPAEALAAAAPLAAQGRLLASNEAQADLWSVRSGGLGLIMNVPGETHPIEFIEDVAVPVERLGEYVREVDRIVAAHNTSGLWYAHASAGCLHFRPMLNMKTAGGLATMRAIAEEVTTLTARMGGALSGEHGDGLSRSEFVEPIFGPRLKTAFGELKAAFDPNNHLNPGKILPAPTSKLDRDLRYEANYKLIPVETIFAFRREGSLAGAVEDCVGAAACRQVDGVMCPSYQATREEKDSTRGRANALRGALSGQLPAGALTSPQIHAVLDLCLECKGCRAECPTGVDMARVKAEYLHLYQAEHGVPLRSRVFAEIAAVGRMVRPVAGIVNAANRAAPLRGIVSKMLGLAPQRPLPHFVTNTFRSWWGKQGKTKTGEEVVMFVDTYTDSNQPEIGQAAVRVLEAAGCRVTVVKQQGCCGRPMISKGLLLRARESARRNVEALAPYAERGLPIVGLEPSCLFTLRDEYLEFFPNDPRAKALAGAAMLIEEYLTRPDEAGKRVVDRLRFQSTDERWKMHGHCHAKSLIGTGPTLAMLRAAGLEVEEIPSGCCGMAGSFGYEAEHYGLSMQIGEMKLLPAVRAAETAGERVTAHGTSCRAQIMDGAGVKAVHPIEVMARLIS